MATKVRSFQIGTGDLEIVDIPDFTDSSKEIKGQHILIVAEVREGMTAQDQFRRFTKGISAFEESENEGNGLKTK